MRVLVTGASGFIGSHLVDHLLLGDFQIRAFCRRSPDQIHLDWTDAVQFVQGDILDRASVDRALQGIDLVYHLAAELGMGTKAKGELQRVNIEGSRNVIEACQRAQIQRLVFCSSVGVLGDVGPTLVDETCTPRPEDAYEQSKYAAELLAVKAAQTIPVVIIRPAWVYGPRDLRTLKLFRMIASGHMFLLGKAENKMHPVHVSDVVQALVKAGQIELDSGSIFHIAGPDVVTVRELLDTVAKLSGTRILPFRFPISGARLIAAIAEPAFKLVGLEAPLTHGKIGFFIKNRAYSIEKARTMINYEPMVKLEHGLCETLNWYNDHKMLSPRTGMKERANC
ncbi:NAD-dependent epimerase/dehydratase family protein [bacterium]|nr:NAD-dependent epimerase/dehydratase family protein [bacterium]